MTVARTRWPGALASIVCGAALAAGLASCEDEQAWMTYTTDDGLAHDAVESVETGPDGVVWAGTHAGVSRLDGQEWTTFSHQQAAPVSSRADEVAMGANGELWAASWEGVACFDGERWNAHGEADGLPDWPVTAVAAAGEDEVLAASDGVYRFDGQRWQQMDGSPREVRSLTVADDGTVSAAVDTVSDGEALFEFDGQDWHAHVTREHLDVDADDASGEVVPGRLVRSVAIDDGVLWAGTDEGVASHDGQGWSHYTVDDGLPHDGARAVTVDGDGHVWAATLDEGVPDPDHAVARFDGQQWSTYTTEDGLPDGWINDLSVADDGTVWAATAAGLARLERDG